MFQLGVKSFTLVVVASFAVGLVLAMQDLKVGRAGPGPPTTSPPVWPCPFSGIGFRRWPHWPAARAAPGWPSRLGSMEDHESSGPHQSGRWDQSSPRTMGSPLINPCCTTVCLLHVVLLAEIVYLESMRGLRDPGAGSPRLLLHPDRQVPDAEGCLSAGHRQVSSSLGDRGHRGCYYGHRIEHGTFGWARPPQTAVVRSILLSHCRCLSHQTHHLYSGFRGRSRGPITSAPAPPSPLDRVFGEDAEKSAHRRLEADPGTMVILGRSGSGNALTDMLVGLNTPDQGGITVEGVEITEFATDSDLEEAGERKHRLPLPGSSWGPQPTFHDRGSCCSSQIGGTYPI